MITIHGRSITESLHSRHFVCRLLTRWMLRQMDLIIACNPDIRRECLEQARLPPGKVRVIPAFVPPDLQKVPEPPDYVRRFIDTHEPVLFAVGWIGIRYRDMDVYGIDMLVTLVERLAEVRRDLGLIICANGGAPDAIQATVRKCRQRVGDRVLLVTPALSDTTRVMQAADLFLRPTNTDGDAVSVREALYVGTPVVASDAVPRPEPCVVFETGDINAFTQAVSTALENLPRLREQTTHAHLSDSAGEIIQAYTNLLSTPVAG